MCSITVANDWIRTGILWYQKWPLCQLCYNHCPSDQVFSCREISFNIFCIHRWCRAKTPKRDSSWYQFQCDQFGRIFKVLGKNISYKSSTIYLPMIWLFWITNVTLRKTASVTIWATIVKFRLLLIPTSGRTDHWVRYRRSQDFRETKSVRVFCNHLGQML